MNDNIRIYYLNLKLNIKSKLKNYSLKSKTNFKSVS